MLGKVLEILDETEVADGTALLLADQKLIESRGPTSFVATVTGTGAVTATVVVEGSHDGTLWVEIATITLSGTTSATDGFVETLMWPRIRANCTAITGTDANVIVTMAQ